MGRAKSKSVNTPGVVTMFGRSTGSGDCLRNCTPGGSGSARAVQVRQAPASNQNPTTPPTPRPSCDYSISPTSVDFPGSGGTNSVSVRAATGCAWAAESLVPWLTIALSASTGSGFRTVSPSRGLPNSGETRQGRMRIAGHLVTEPATSPPRHREGHRRGKATNPSPGNGATGVSLTPTLRWTASADATSYDVSFGRRCRPHRQRRQPPLAMVHRHRAPTLPDQWRIDAKNSAGTATGDTWSFTTGATPPTGTVPGKATNPAPSNGATGVSLTPTLRWTAPADATSYDVYNFGATLPSTPTETVRTAQSHASDPWCER